MSGVARNRRKPWVVLWNVPGYLPESDPLGPFDTFADASMALRDELARHADQLAEDVELSDTASESDKAQEISDIEDERLDIVTELLRMESRGAAERVYHFGGWAYEIRHA